MPNGWAKLEKIEGIGPQYADKLRKAGVRTLHSLIAKGADPKGRKSIAESIGVSPATVLEWVNRADLFRVRGIGEEYSDLLEKAGVDTVPELANRQPANLYVALGQVNAAKNLVRRMPTESQVKAWVKHAKTLKRVIVY